MVSTRAERARTALEDLTLAKEESAVKGGWTLRRRIAMVVRLLRRGEVWWCREPDVA